MTPEVLNTDLPDESYLEPGLFVDRPKDPEEPGYELWQLTLLHTDRCEAAGDYCGDAKMWAA